MGASKPMPRECQLRFEGPAPKRIRARRLKNYESTKQHMHDAGLALNEFISTEPDVSICALIQGGTLYELTKPAKSAKSKPRKV